MRPYPSPYLYSIYDPKTRPYTYVLMCSSALTSW
jgi:hypothetical protein